MVGGKRGEGDDEAAEPLQPHRPQHHQCHHDANETKGDPDAGHRLHCMVSVSQAGVVMHDRV